MSGETGRIESNLLKALAKTLPSITPDVVVIATDCLITSHKGKALFIHGTNNSTATIAGTNPHQTGAK